MFSLKFRVTIKNFDRFFDKLTVAFDEQLAIIWQVCLSDVYLFEQQ